MKKISNNNNWRTITEGNGKVEKYIEKQKETKSVIIIIDLINCGKRKCPRI